MFNGEKDTVFRDEAPPLKMEDGGENDDCGCRSSGVGGEFTGR